MLIILVKRYHLGTEKVMYTQDIKLRGENFMENKSKSSVVYQGKIPGRVKYSFAFGALDKNLIYGMIATLSMIYSWIYTLITQEAVMVNLFLG